MAGFSLFGNYSRPGPGVRKDEPKKPPLLRFFQLYFRKFTNLIQLNLLFAVPVIVVAALIYLISQFTAQPLILGIPLILLSPFYAGLTFVTRNYAREEHAFIFSDFKDTVISNWKLFLVNGVICYLFLSLISVCLNFYYSISSKGVLFMIPFGISVMILFLFLFAQYYIPLMIVTFDLKLKQLYKNGLIFAIVGLWRNLLLTAILAALFFINYLLFYLFPALMILIDGILLLLFAFSFVSYLVNFTVYPLIEKMMIKPYYEKQNAAQDGDSEDEQNDDSDGPEQSTADDAEGEKDEKPSAPPEESEYVFYNGKLVKRSSLRDGNDSVFEDRT